MSAAIQMFVPAPVTDTERDAHIDCHMAIAITALLAKHELPDLEEEDVEKLFRAIDAGRNALESVLLEGRDAQGQQKTPETPGGSGADS
jgi:hypothetical protein